MKCSFTVIICIFFPCRISPVSLRALDYWFLFHYSKGEEIKEYKPASVQVLLLCQVPAGGLSCDSAQSRCPLSQPNLEYVLSSQWENAVFLYQVGNWAHWERVPQFLRDYTDNWSTERGCGAASEVWMPFYRCWSGLWLEKRVCCRTHPYLVAAEQSPFPENTLSVCWSQPWGA